MSDKFWTHLKLKNGDKVKFVPPAPDGDQLGGITQNERNKISEVENKQDKVVAGSGIKLGQDGKTISADLDSTLLAADKAAPANIVGELKGDIVLYLTRVRDALAGGDTPSAIAILDEAILNFSVLG